jgi:hypothetical protein
MRKRPGGWPLGVYVSLAPTQRTAAKNVHLCPNRIAVARRPVWISRTFPTAILAQAELLPLPSWP